MTRPSSLRRRLIAAAAAWLALALSAGAVVLGLAFRDSAEQGLRERLLAHLRALAAVVDVAADGTVRVGQPAGEPRFEQPYSGWYWQVARAGEVVARSRSLWDFALPLSAAPADGAVVFRTDRGPRGESLATAERDFTLAEGGAVVHVAIAAGRSKLEAEVRRFDLLLALSLGGLGAGLIAAIALQVGYGLRPLGDLTRELDALRRTGGRVRGAYPSEVAPLVAAMNDVLDHDDKMIARARAHLGNLAHAFKTPLAVVEAELSSPTLDRAVLSAQVGRLGRLIDVHLARARAEARPAAATAAAGTPVGPVAVEIARALERIHAERDLVIEIACADEARLPVTHDDLAEILGNLMDNACKWARRRVVVRAAGDHVAVEDDGNGLSEAEIALCLARGARLDESAPGSGLGLAIVADLAGLTGLDLAFGRSDLGGLRVSLSVASGPVRDSA